MLSRKEALVALHRSNAADTPDNWTCPIGPITFRFPNFKWRRRALAAHDLHHLMTGYPMTMRGEFQLAAWEWGAGRFPHWGAILFCLPLIIAGLMWSPSRMHKAWQRGRRSRTLYSSLKAAPDKR